MLFNLDLISVFILVVVILNSSLGLFIYISKKERVNKNFFIFSLAATCWGLSMLLFRSGAGTNLSVLFARILYASAATIPFVFLFFIRIFPEEKFTIPAIYARLLSLPFLAIVYISLTPNLLILGTSPSAGSEQIIYFNRFYHTIYAFYIMISFSICYGVLFVKYFKFTGLEKIQIAYVILGTFIATIIGVSTNLIMPYLGDFSLNWMGQIGIIAMIGAISYSILQHKLFDMKVIATQFIVFILCTSQLARLLFSSNQQEKIIDGSFLIITIIVGIFLIRSVIREVELREKIEKQEKDLEIANGRLKELDELKSEFLSLATHQIRAPLTAVKGYASLILEGDYGEVSKDIRHAVQTIFNSCENLVVIVNEFLDISRIEQGRMKYDLTNFDVQKLTEEVITEFKPNIENAGLSVIFTPDEHGTYKAYADIGKVKQILGNIIDNAVKYTKEGSIKVSLSHEANKTRIAVSDNGIGISHEDIPKLFGKFIRAKEANKTNVIGTGLGLYVAKQMAEAQGGRIWVESKGVGHGSTFFVELPS